MKSYWNRACSMLLSGAILLGAAVPAISAEDDMHEAQQLIGEIAVGRYEGDTENPGHAPFIKISHPDKPGSKMEFDPKKEAEQHAQEVYADGLLDYIVNHEASPEYGILGVPGVDEGANGQGDRGQTYSWAGFAYGDWMYVSTLFNSTGMTGGLLGQPTTDDMKDVYGEDMYIAEEDGKASGSTLSKINVKTGEVKIIMSMGANGLETSFRNAVEFGGKLYFTGSVNHLPTIFEIDPETDAFQCVYIDQSLVEYPGGPGEAWKEARARGVCPTIRGMTVFQDHLIISTVGMDGNPYIAVSDDPSSGSFTTIARTWADDEHTIPGELLGYPACRLQDSIMGGSIWEMAEFNDKLYVAIATGTPENAPDSYMKPSAESETGEVQVLKTMQSFALIAGTCNGDVSDPDAWTWEPIVGDLDDGAKYTFGIDPERHRSGACNLIVFDDHLYIGEYNDTQIAFQNMIGGEFDFVARNLDESVSLYRLDKDNNIEKVMGDPTEMFPEPIAGSDDPKYADRTQSGFGRRESQYIWQSKVYNGKLYLGTFDETAILQPIGAMALDTQIGVKPKQLSEDLTIVTDEAEQVLAAAEAAVLAEDAAETAVSEEQMEVYAAILEARDAYDMRAEASSFADFVESTVEDANVLLPAAVFENAPVVEVTSPDTLYLGLRNMADLMDGNDERSTREQLAAKVTFTEQYEAVMNYLDTTEDEIPTALTDAAAPFAAAEPRQKIETLQDVMKYMVDAIAGFDMYVSEDGINFEQITRSGLGDPYNQGLRVFAANNSEENPWMCVGTANPFYGTQIWRMEDEIMNLDPIDPARFDVSVRLVDPNGQSVQRDWHQANRISAVEGAVEIDPASISILVPEGRELVSSKPMPIETDAVTGEKYITMVVSAADTEPSEPAPTEPAEPLPTLPSGSEQFTLTFHTNGGSLINDLIAEVGTLVDLTLYNPVRTGYRFHGWYADEGLTQRITDLTLNSHTTVYARWIPILTENPFTDVPDDAYYTDSVLWAVENGITDGMTDTTFGPNKPANRAHSVTFLWRAAGQPQPTTSDIYFTDVLESEYFADPVRWAIENGITNGMTKTTFGPQKDTTRGQIVTFLWRMAGCPKPESQHNPFWDVYGSDYYYDAVVWAAENGITLGTTSTSFSPNEECTRAQIVTFLHRYMGD